MQTITRITTNLAHFVWKIFLLEIVLLLLVGLLWRLLGWYTTESYSAVLNTVGVILIAIGLLSLAGGRSSGNIKLAEAEMEMRSLDHSGQRRFTSPYAERSRISSWLISLGIVTVVIGMGFSVFRL